MILVKGFEGAKAFTVDVEFFRFPGGEWHARIKNPDALLSCSNVEISALIQNADQIMQLLMLTDALRRSAPAVKIGLNMPYVPYARQDRVANAGEPLSIRVFCDLINAQQYEYVVVQDPHSDVTTALLNRVVVDSSLQSLKKIIDQTGPVALLSPDAGAQKRVSYLAKLLDCPVVCAEKVRDTVSGQLSATRIQGALPDLPLLVVDDICDGGGTFIALADAVKRARGDASEPHPLYLYVTHGIFSKGADMLIQRYQRIFTRHCWNGDPRCEIV